MDVSDLFARTPSLSHLSREFLDTLSPGQRTAAQAALSSMRKSACLSLRLKGKCSHGILDQIFVSEFLSLSLSLSLALRM